jgi:ParB-like chromosome segregation protein Spo0J
MDSKIKTIKLDQIDPLHEVRDADKLASLTEAMASGGWVGRPLLVQDTGEGWYQAWTGSHRIAAAIAAELDTVTCMVIEDASLDCRGDDTDRWAALNESGFDDEAELMAQEDE